MTKPRANNYFHVRVYTDDTKIELYRDRKQPSTLRQIIDGLKRSIDVLEQVERVVAAKAETGNGEKATGA